MKKEIQDLLWSALSKEQRDFERFSFSITPNDGYKRGYAEAYADIFGLHNLTSDTEPEEMLSIKKEKFDNFYKYLEYCYNHDSCLYDDLYWKFVECLPDKSPKNEAELGQNLGHSVQLSVQVEDKPRFGKGDKVRLNCRDKRGEVWDPVTDGRVVTIKETYLNATTGVRMYAFEEGIRDFAEGWLEPYTEENKETMEEKELDLTQLLKDCEGEMLYSLIDGEVKLKQLTDDVICQYHKYHRSGYLSGCALDGFCQLYPSRALYEKYPLEPVKAWNEWAENRKPKRWRAKQGEEYWYLSALNTPEMTSDDAFNGDDKLYELGNYFRTEELAEQAAEGFREYLKKFHEEHTEQ